MRRRALAQAGILYEIKVGRERETRATVITERFISFLQSLATRAIMWDFHE
jgi:hypothetical protein